MGFITGILKLPFIYLFIYLFNTTLRCALKNMAHDEIRRRINSENLYYSVQKLSRLSKTVKLKIYKTISTTILYGCEA
jgi:hypothetical protein